MSLRILIIGPAWVGDMVVAQGLFKLLRAQYSTMQLDVAAPAWTLPLLQRMPEVNSAILLPFTHGELRLRNRYQLALQLQKNGYDQAIVLPHSFKSALLPWLARIPQRTGYLGEYRYLLLNDLRRLQRDKHLLIEEFAALGLSAGESLPKKLPYPSLSVSVTEKKTVSRPILALAAGAAYGDAKCWGAENYAALANHKLRDGWEIWLFGSEKDRLITDQIMSLTHDRCSNLAGKLILTETIDLLSLVTGVVTNDSGLMHIAAALGKPLVALYGPTSPAVTPPLTDRASIVQLALACQPCFARSCPLKHHRCMRDLSPDRVLPIIADWK
jgi:heptosyltransferase-2